MAELNRDTLECIMVKSAALSEPKITMKIIDQRHKMYYLIAVYIEISGITIYMHIAGSTVTGKHTAEKICDALSKKMTIAHKTIITINIPKLADVFMQFIVDNISNYRDLKWMLVA